MAVQQIGPLFYINGPLPRAPRYGLVQNADLIDVGDEHWANGIQVHGYIPDNAAGWSVCAAEAASPPDSKASQELANPLPEFGPLTAYLTETCSTRTMERTQEAFTARAKTTFAAVEGAVVEDQFWNGTWLPDNPHLTDSNVDVLNSGGATSALNGLAMLEDAIADTHRAGVIHMSAGLAVYLSGFGVGVLIPERGALYTITGTLVIPGYGYDGSGPEGEQPVTGTEEYAYATGPVEVLRSEAFLMPPDVAQAVDRTTNTIEYRAERYYIPFWDTALQAGVKIDRCFTTCDQ